MSLYETYRAKLERIADLSGAIALMHWDQEVNAPEKGAGFRAKQLATLTGLSHEWFTEPSFGDLLKNLNEGAEDLTEEQAANVRLSLEDYNKAVRFSKEFVEALSKARSEAYQAWIKARKAKDYAVFEPALAKIVALKRQEAAYLQPQGGHPYDGLLDQYEKGASVAMLDPIFAQIRADLVAFTKALRTEGKATERSFLDLSFDVEKQWQHSLDLLKNMGYDFGAGRQDRSEHPFTTGFSPYDVRVTARVAEHDPMSLIGTCLHEGGHALYEQGLPSEQYGLPLGSATSLGIHESQSRLWENHLGLSLAYWKAHYADFQARYPEQLGGVDLETFYRAINQVKPNFIRVEADELHYHLHVLIRYEIEKGLLEGKFEAKGLDKVWNAMYAEYLGLTVEDDKLGILQDVHWCEGLLGYFPTYSLGSLYAAQFFAQAQKDIEGLDEKISRGDSSELLAWLRAKIHIHGRRYTSEVLCKQITGEGLNPDYFMTYVKSKYGAIYEL